MAFSLFSFGASAIEEPHYDVVDTLGDIEIRSYAPHNVAMTRVEADFDQVGNRAFRRLAGYIFGDNERDQKIAMTAPVSQGKDAQGGYWVTFMMPAEYPLDSLPLPDDAEVKLVPRPAQTMAAIRYRGGWGEQKYAEHEQALMRALAKSARWVVTGEPVWARYNAPFVPPFMRHNEVLVPVAEK